MGEDERYEGRKIWEKVRFWGILYHILNSVEAKISADPEGLKFIV